MTEPEARSVPLACATGKVRLYVETALAPGAAVEASQEQSHYLTRVMRLRPGASVLLFNGRDGEWRAVLAGAGKRSVTLHVEDLRRPQDSVPDLTLLFAPVKRARLDFLVQRAVELGVAALRPVITRRTVVERVNLERMAANAVEAAEQCGRMSVPRVLPAESLAVVIRAWPQGHRLLFCDEMLPEEKASAAAAVLDALEPGARGVPWSVLTGPEGGFDPAERAALRTLPGATPIGLGPRILRADTAAVAALALWQSRLGDW